MSGGGFGGGVTSGGGGVLGAAKGMLASVGDLLGGPEQGVLQTIQGVKTGNIGDVLRGTGILVGTGAGALLGGPVGAVAGGRLAEALTDHTDGGERLDPVQTLGLPQFGGIGGLAEHIGAGMATDPMMFLTGGASQAAQAGDEAAQGVSDAAQQGLRLRVPILSNRLEAAGIPASISAPQSLVDGGSALRQSALNAIPAGDGMSLADKLSDVGNRISAAVVPQASRAATLVAGGMDPERAAELTAKGGLVDTGFAQAKGVQNTMLGNFDAQAAAIQKTGGDMQPFLQQSADKVGLSLDSSDGLSLADVRSGVSSAAHDAGTQAFGDFLESHDIPLTRVKAGPDDMPGVEGLDGPRPAWESNAPTKVQLPGDAAPVAPPTPLTDAQRAAMTTSDYFHVPDDAARAAYLQSVRDAGPLGAAQAPGRSLADTVDQLRGFENSPRNPLTGNVLTEVNPEASQLQGLYADRPSLKTGQANKLYRQANLAKPMSQVKYALGDVVRNAMDPAISGIGDVGKAASLQWALHSIPDEAIAAKGLEGAAKDALSPEQFQLWTQARQQGVLSSGYQADTSASGALGKLAAPLRAEGDNARLANFSDRMGQGASAEDAAAGVRGTQYDLSDTTPTVAAIRRLAIPGANFMAHNVPAQLGAAIANPALAAGTLHAEQATQDPMAPGWVKGLLTSSTFETPFQSALLGKNPVTGVMQMAGGDVKGGMASLGGLPSGPTPVGLTTDLYKASQHKGSPGSAIDEVLGGTVPGLRTIEPAAQAAQPAFAGGQQDPMAALQALLGTSSPSSTPTATPQLHTQLTRAGIHLPSLPTAKSILKRK